MVNIPWWMCLPEQVASKRSGEAVSTFFTNRKSSTVGLPAPPPPPVGLTDAEAIDRPLRPGILELKIGQEREEDALVRRRRGEPLGDAPQELARQVRRTRVLAPHVASQPSVALTSAQASRT